ncbi:FHA domain-containing protein [Streptomyces sp. NPDC052077]|uniref:FHA domain-containing protein n=1 Tax=Streptomyces sp. NPDC052077 TaxID=3154757 RepID=UPI0034124411
MQIRLTVVDPQGPPSAPGGGAPSRDVLVTAPAGTALAAVASALAAALPGDGGTGPVVLYAGAQRLDTQRCTLGEPPLTDGAVLSLGAPGEPEPHPGDLPARLHVVAGPDAGGVHLLHGGCVRLGRSADADVALDDPDVSRTHCAVTVDAGGGVTVADLGSTNGTTLDGVPVTARPVRFPPGALLRIGESVLRLVPAGQAEPRGPRATPDGEGHVRLPVLGTPGPAGDGAGPGPADGPAAPYGPAGAPGLPGVPGGPTRHAYGTSAHQGAARPGGAGGAAAPVGGYGAPAYGQPPTVPGQGGAPGIESRAPAPGTPLTGAYGPHDTRPGAAPEPGDPSESGAGAQQGGRRRGGLGAWARRLAGGRGAGAREAEGPEACLPDGEAPVPGPGEPVPPLVAGAPETWPDPAALLLTALGPGPRLWERGAAHPEALSVRLGTADRAVPGRAAPLPAVPVTVGLRGAGALGLAGPRARLSGLARSVLAQLAALHSPDVLEIVLIGADRARPLDARVAEWSWLGWLPQMRPGHGQDCRLLLAHDPDQAAARIGELLRRLEDRPGDGPRVEVPTRLPAPGPVHGPGPVHAPGRAMAPSPAPFAAPGAIPGAGAEAAGSGPGSGSGREQYSGAPGGSGGRTGPYTVVVVDGDPGGAELREAVARLAVEGPWAGIHVLCVAETAPAAPAAPVAEAYEAACAGSPLLRECGAVALLSGDVATAVRLLRIVDADVPGVPPGPAGEGVLGTVDAVSPAWAERFARALAPLRTDGAGGGRRVSAPLPRSARLLDELGLARATPASLMARWAAAADDPQTLGGRAQAVLGAGPRGPVAVDLAAEGPHLLVEGPPGSGRTELLRAVVASLASAERPDRLGIVLIDGRDGAGTGGAASGEGLRVCTDVPHVTTHLAANDPVLMREFAQSLSAELKRRAELLGRSDFTTWHTGRAVSGRMVAQRTAGGVVPGVSDTGDLESPPSSTIRLRPGAARARTEPVPPLPRLVVVVDDLDDLVAPSLGSTGRPAAGSVVRALEAVAREGERLGVHLVAATGPGGRTARTEPVRLAALRVVLDAPAAGPDEPAPGRGRLTGADGRGVGFQGGRVTGRIPRTATLRPTVVALEWDRMGDPPARRPVRELGNGPTDLALLASALDRASRQVSAPRVPSLLR